jgi:two-component system response regulator DevR
MGKAMQTDFQPGASLRVFIVEDSQPVRERLEQLLASIDGIQCVGSAASADTAVSAILKIHPDAVILDIWLAQGTGFDVLRALKGRIVDSPVYVFSNLATEPYRRLAAQLGASAFFDKTTQIDDMRKVLTERVEEHKTLLH